MTKSTIQEQTSKPAAAPIDIFGTMSLKQTWATLGISHSTGYLEIERGRLRMCKIGGKSVTFAEDRKAYKELLQREADERLSRRQRKGPKGPKSPQPQEAA